MTTNISRETGRLSLLLRSPAKFEPYALPSPPLSLFSILDEDFIQVSYSDLLSASWQRDDAAWQYVKIITSARLFTEEKNKKKGRERKERKFLSTFSSSLLSRYARIFISPPRFETAAFSTTLFSEANVSMPNSQRREQSCQARRHPLNN